MPRLRTLQGFDLYKYQAESPKTDLYLFKVTDDDFVVYVDKNYYGGTAKIGVSELIIDMILFPSKHRYTNWFAITRGLLDYGRGLEAKSYELVDFNDIVVNPLNPINEEIQSKVMPGWLEILKMHT